MTVNTAEGGKVNLSKYKGKVLLIVNVASACKSFGCCSTPPLFQSEGSSRERGAVCPMCSNLRLIYFFLRRLYPAVHRPRRPRQQVLRPRRRRSAVQPVWQPGAGLQRRDRQVRQGQGADQGGHSGESGRERPERNGPLQIPQSQEGRHPRQRYQMEFCEMCAFERAVFDAVAPPPPAPADVAAAVPAKSVLRG